MLPLDYTLCDNSDCQSRNDCDRYQSLQTIRNGNDNYAKNRIITATFKPNPDTDKCGVFIAIENV
jgi:hypothetical protein